MVYVDDMRAPYGRMIMCHMAADTYREFLGMSLHLESEFPFSRSKSKTHEGCYGV
jgi:hypothetical protein